jgi:ADP-ribose pyrophosphatase YjhB (NUDIX family)
VDLRRDHRKAGGILIYNGRVLIVQSRADKWGFPKGGFEKGENALQCAEREVYEETSFNVRFSDDDPKIEYKDTTFYVKHLQNEPPEIDTTYLKTPGNDCTGIGWIRLTCLKRHVKKALPPAELAGGEQPSVAGGLRPPGLAPLGRSVVPSAPRSVVERLKNLTLHSISDSEEPPQVMQFNLGVRKFVKQYMARSKRALKRCE